MNDADSCLCGAFSLVLIVVVSGATTIGGGSSIILFADLSGLVGITLFAPPSFVNSCKCGSEALESDRRLVTLAAAFGLEVNLLELPKGRTTVCDFPDTPLVGLAALIPGDGGTKLEFLFVFDW